jgi:protocatechuate 3,4-dioxygenase beta subunit
MAVAVAILWATLALQPAQAPANAQISGRVVASGSGAPIEGAQVMLVPIRRANPTGATPTFPAGMPPQRATDPDGKFIFEHVIPGEYRLNVNKSGFITVPIPGPGGAPPPTFTLEAGQVLDAGVIALTKGGVIAGRVLDPSGEPVANARVVAMRRPPRPIPNMTFIQAGQPGQTNDLGEFRVFGLPTGEYIVVAAQNNVGGATSAKTVLAPTYFPATPDQSAATPVNVTAPEPVNGLEIHLISVPAYEVSGFVVDANGEPVPNAMVMLMPSARPPMIIGGPFGNGRTGPKGGFTLTGVPAGTYRATASQIVATPTGSTTTFGFSSGPGMPPAGTEVTVTDANVSGVRVVVTPR